MGLPEHPALPARLAVPATNSAATTADRAGGTLQFNVAALSSDLEEHPVGTVACQRRLRLRCQRRHPVATTLEADAPRQPLTLNASGSVNRAIVRRGPPAWDLGVLRSSTCAAISTIIVLFNRARAPVLQCAGSGPGAAVNELAEPLATALAGCAAHLALIAHPHAHWRAADSPSRRTGWRVRRTHRHRSPGRPTPPCAGRPSSSSGSALQHHLHGGWRSKPSVPSQRHLPTAATSSAWRCQRSSRFGLLSCTQHARMLRANKSQQSWIVNSLSSLQRQVPDLPRCGHDGLVAGRSRTMRGQMASATGCTSPPPRRRARSCPGRAAGTPPSSAAAFSASAANAPAVLCVPKAASGSVAGSVISATGRPTAVAPRVGRLQARFRTSRAPFKSSGTPLTVFRADEQQAVGSPAGRRRCMINALLDIRRRRAPCSDRASICVLERQRRRARDPVLKDFWRRLPENGRIAHHARRAWAQSRQDLLKAFASARDELSEKCRILQTTADRWRALRGADGAGLRTATAAGSPPDHRQTRRLYTEMVTTGAPAAGDGAITWTRRRA